MTFKRPLRWIIALLLIAALALASIAVARRNAQLAVPVAVLDRHWVGSASCQSCHEDRHASWYRTFHRTMTQEASADAVLGAFDGQRLDADGIALRPVQRNGGYAFDYLDPVSGEVIGTAPIMRTVGSHRYQQYLARVDGNDYRLEFLWHIGDRRWVPVNAAFLHPDGLPGDHSVSLWNQNCIYCHNTGPRPQIQNYDDLAQRARSGQAVDINRDARYASEVAELGIGCETCHGPGSVHMDRSATWLDRMLLRWAPGADAAMVQPQQLDATRSSQICAQCHAQRMPPDAKAMLGWLGEGPTFRAGENLDDHVRVVHADTPSPDPRNPDLFRLRFWADGSPRLSAYEWQGMTQSACMDSGKLGCLNCHAMHAGDPAGMITERQRSDAPCLACHQDIAADTGKHTRHSPDSPGARCQNCHMPYQVYGVMNIQRSHRISRPDPAISATSGAPNACTGCHVDRTLDWVQQQLQAGWGAPTQVLPARIDGAPQSRADALAGLVAGDAAQQAIWAERIGADDSGIALRDRAVLIPALIEALADRYPSTRRFAGRSLLALGSGLPVANADALASWSGALAAFDFVAPAEARAAQLAAIRQSWSNLDKSTLPAPDPVAHCIQPDWQLDAACMAQLRELGARSDRQISIGE